MTKHAVKAAILAVFLALSGLTYAGPAQQERAEFCKNVVTNVQAGADAKRLNMSEEDLNDRLFQYAIGVLQNGVSKQDVKRLVEAVFYGYVTEKDALEATQAKLFTSCMDQKEI